MDWTGLDDIERWKAKVLPTDEDKAFFKQLCSPESIFTQSTSPSTTAGTAEFLVNTTDNAPDVVVGVPYPEFLKLYCGEQFLWVILLRINLDIEFCWYFCFFEIILKNFAGKTGNAETQ